MRARRRAVQLMVVGAVSAAAVVGFGPLSAGPAGADTGPTFDATATAYGVDPTIANASLPLGLTIEGAGPVATAHLDSIGDSDALGSFPYPGETVAGLPGTAGALFGIPTPEYPLFVTSQAGDKPKTGGAPGIALTATSYPGAAIGQAVIGTLGAGFTSTASVTVNTDNSVTSHAETAMGVNLLNLINITGVDSLAEVTADATSGDLTRTTHLSIGEISIPGLNLNVPANTPNTIPIPIPIPGVPQLPPIKLPVMPLPLGGETIPTPNLGFEDGSFTITLPLPGIKPLKFAVPASIVLSSLKVLGINVTYETAQDNSTGVVAPALTFTMRAPSPPKNSYFNGPTDIGFVLGRSTASVTLHPATSTGGDAFGGTGGSFGGGTGTTGSVGVGGVSVAGGSTLPSSSGGVLPLGTGSTSSSPVTGGGGATTGTNPATPGGQMALVSRDASKADLSGIYLLGLAIAGAVAAAATVLKVMGVRLLWGS